MPDQVALPTHKDLVPECVQDASQGIGGHLDKQVVAKGFHKFASDAERFKFVWENPVTHDVITLIPEYEGKSDEKASELRTRGNAYFRKKSFLSATQSYSDAIIQAESDAERGLAYGNRSASLYHMGNFEFSIKDAERAIENGYPAENAFKLRERQALCWKGLDNKENAVEYLRKAKDGLAVSGLKDKFMQECESRLRDLSEEIESIGTDQKSEKVNYDYNRKSYVGKYGNYSKSVISSPKKDMTEVSGERNDDFRNMSGLLNVKKDEERGRFIYTKADVEVGDVLVSEEPYTSILYRANYVTHCYNCMVRTLAPVPCVQCMHVSYCSEKCRDSAWSRYHQWECRFSVLFEESWCGKIGHLAHRTVMETGVGNILAAEKENISSTGVPAGYQQILEMPANTKEQLSENLYKHSIMTCFLVKLLRVSGVFRDASGASPSETDATDPASDDVVTVNGDAPVVTSAGTKKGDGDTPGVTSASTTELKEDTPVVTSDGTKQVGEGAPVLTSDDVIKLGGAILRLIQIIQMNAKGVRELMQPTDFENPKSQDIGTGLYLTCALFNHDCFPNAALIYYGNKVVLKAIRGIFEGQEVSLNYGPAFYTTGKLRRQRFLRTTYLFMCSCAACKDDWPHYKDVEEQYPVFCCSRCHRFVDLTNIEEERVLMCDHCGEAMDIQVAWGQLGVAHDQFVKSLEEAVSGKAECALPGFVDYLKLMQRYIMMPWKDLLMCQAAVETTYKLRGNSKPYH